MEVFEILETIKAAQREAAVLMLEARDILAEAKGDRRNVVTEYDRRVQELLVRRLGGALPEARFFCEEMDRQDDLDGELVFIIDPIDGTMNFVHGLSQSCISVALRSRGETLAAAVYNPYLDEMFEAVRGGGARLNGKPIRVTPAPLEETVIAFGSAPYDPDLTEETFRLAKLSYQKGLDVRRMGSAALDLCSVAAGRAGVYFELQVSLWDWAAGALIAEEAGGIVTRLDGSPLPGDGRRSSCLAGSPQTVRRFLELAAE